MGSVDTTFDNMQVGVGGAGQEVGWMLQFPCLGEVTHTGAGRDQGQQEDGWRKGTSAGQGALGQQAEGGAEGERGTGGG